MTDERQVTEPVPTTEIARALATAPVAARPTTALAATDQQRAIAEVQAALIIARANPRDIIHALDLIQQDCMRPGLAERALYNYARGGTDISGPSIRLAECIAQRWGNIQYGIRELEQRSGESVIQAYAWDVETNTRRETTFTVPHVRDTKRGRVRLEEARDIYEMTANMGARRVRACILGIIPGDIVDAAVQQVNKTLHTRAEVTPERLQSLVEKFAAYGVTKQQIETRIQRRLEAMTPALMVSLGNVYNSLRDGMSSPGDWFDMASAEEPHGNNRSEMLRATLQKRIAENVAIGQSEPPAANAQEIPTETTTGGMNHVDPAEARQLDLEAAAQTDTRTPHKRGRHA